MSESVIVRYIPIGRDVFLPARPSVVHHPIVKNASVMHTVVKKVSSTSFSSIISFESIALVMYVTILIIFVIASLILIFLPRRSTSIAVRSVSKRGVEEFRIDLLYHYEGIKAVLRRLFLELRSRHLCRNCTPRELASSNPHLSRFADLYEDVVYGDKQRMDIDTVVAEVRKLWIEGSSQS